MQHTVTINSKLYSTLYNEGIERGINADTLISVYCKIKLAKQGKDRIRPIKTESGRIIKYYRLLHRTTNISEKTLKKYIPILEELKIFNFSKDGSCYIKGNDKTNKEFKLRKTIRIKVEKTISDTNLNVFFVRIKAKEKRIQTAIDRTNSKIKVMSRLEGNLYIPKKDIKKALKWYSEGVTVDKLKSHHNKVVLSNQGFYLLKNEIEDKKSAGYYHKNKLESAGKIKTRRNSIQLKKCSKEEFNTIKYRNRRISLYKGYLWEETIAEFTTTEFKTKKPYIKEDSKPRMKPKDYLSHDMIAEWVNRG